jgi:hypothetical protein
VKEFPMVVQTKKAERVRFKGMESAQGTQEVEAELRDGVTLIGKELSVGTKLSHESVISVNQRRNRGVIIGEIILKKLNMARHKNSVGFLIQATKTLTTISNKNTRKRSR